MSLLDKFYCVEAKSSENKCFPRFRKASAFRELHANCANEKHSAQYHANNNGRLQNVGLSMQSGKGPYGINLQTSSNEIRIYGATKAVDDLIPYVARALVNYTLDMKKNSRP